jgi:hypothetical protein
MRDFSLLMSARVPLIEISDRSPHLIEERQRVDLRGRGKSLSKRVVPKQLCKAAARSDHTGRIGGGPNHEKFTFCAQPVSSWNIICRMNDGAAERWRSMISKRTHDDRRDWCSMQCLCRRDESANHLREPAFIVCRTQEGRPQSFAPGGNC